MYKPRNKYFTTNQGNLIHRIMNSNDFSPYEFMSLRYACCETIAEINRNLDGSDNNSFFEYIGYMNNKTLKQLKKSYQRCINHLDKYYFKGVIC